MSLVVIIVLGVAGGILLAGLVALGAAQIYRKRRQVGAAIRETNRTVLGFFKTNRKVFAYVLLSGALLGVAYVAVMEAERWREREQNLRHLRETRELQQRLAAEAEVERQRLAAEVEAEGKRLAAKPGESFKDCAACPEMVVVPAGSFTMGQAKLSDDVLTNLRLGGGTADRDPPHKVEIPAAFAVGKFEVTKDQFQAFGSSYTFFADPSSPGTGGSKCVTHELGKQKGRTHRSFSNPGFKQSGNEPAVCVSWLEAKGYAAWLSKKTGRAYRLLSEAEWEYAARAGTTTLFSTGQTISTDQANFDNYEYRAGGGHYRRKTVKVGSYPVNQFGLYDMHGNVSEWVEDCWNENYSGAPSDGSAWTVGDCRERVLRDGNFTLLMLGLGSARRSRIPREHRMFHTGFRVARTL